MPEVIDPEAARQRSVAVETGGHTYLLTYDPNRFTEEARLAYVAGVADKQSIRAHPHDRLRIAGDEPILCGRVR